MYLQRRVGQVGQSFRLVALERALRRDDMRNKSKIHSDVLARIDSAFFVDLERIRGGGGGKKEERREERGREEEKERKRESESEM